MSQNAVSKAGKKTEGAVLGVFIGVSEYEDANYPPLPSCKSDLDSMCLVMDKIKKFTKIVKLQNEKSAQIKSSLSSLISEYKDKNIEEFFFYFSGHGERIENEFFYVLNDFDSKKVNSTGLSESYLDGLIREANPRVYTKFSDACFSGTKYIKDSLENRKDIIQKQVEGLGLDNVYYFFSSRENQSSYADKKGLSFFTDQIISSIISSEREIKYVDLSGELADAFKSEQYQQQPIFLMQGSYLDSIGTINNEKIDEIMKSLGIEAEAPQNKNNENSENNGEEKSQLEIILEKLIDKSKNNSIEEDQINKVLQNLDGRISNNLNNKIKDAYTVSINYKKDYHVPNGEKIGYWLKKNNDLFAKEAYSTKTVTTKYYDKPDKILVATPQKTSKNDWLSTFSGTSSLLRSLSTNLSSERKEELVLKEKKEKEQYISGFDYTCNDDNNIIQITLEPNHQLLPKIECWFVFIYSHEKFFIHSLFINYVKKSWSTYEQNSNNNWSVSKIVDIKKMTHTSLTNIIRKKTEDYINDEISKILQQ